MHKRARDTHGRHEHRTDYLSKSDLVQKPAPTWVKGTNAGTLTFVDDHLEIWAIRNAGELRAVFKPFIEAQQHFNMETNFKKTQIALYLAENNQ